MSPLPIEGLQRIEKIYATTDYAAAIDEDGALYTWGLNGLSGRLGIGSTSHGVRPSKVNFDSPPLRVNTLALGTYHVLAIVEKNASE